MTKKSATIVFFGNERLATGVTSPTFTLKKLVGEGYNVALVVANNMQGPSRKQRELEIAKAAKTLGIPLAMPKSPRDILARLQATRADLGVLVAYGKIVPKEIIDLFPKGIVNIHPSLLPRHRGPTPLESVLLTSEEHTGVTIMGLVKKMDAGPIYAQRKVRIDGDESKQELADLLLEQGSGLLLKVLPGILDGTLTPKEQDEQLATYDGLIAKTDGLIDWSKPADRIEREIRAYLEWPKSRTTFGGLEVTITKSHVAPEKGATGITTTSGKLPMVYCGRNALVLDLLKPANKKEMTGEAFLAGYKHIFLKTK